MSDVVLGSDRRLAAQRTDLSAPGAADVSYLQAGIQPPGNIQAEQALLGAILANNKAFNLVSGFLQPDHFIDPIHARIYSEAARRILRGQLVDAVTLKDVFSETGTLAEVGGTAYLAQLLAAMVGIVNAGEYGRAIVECWLRRRLAAIGGEMVSCAYGGGDVEASAQLATATEALMELSSRAARDAPMVPIGVAARRAVETADALARGDAGGVLSTGLHKLDRAIGGLRDGLFYILGGRPSMGKTSLSVQVAIAAGRSLRHELLASSGFTIAGGQVLFFSMEMSADELATWAQCHIGRVSNEAFSGERRFTLEEGDALRVAQAELDMLPINIIDAVGLSGPAIALRARAENAKRRVRLVILDHVQKLVAGLGAEARGRFDQTAETQRTTSALKDLARQIGCPVLALCQLKAEVDQRDNPRPRLADLMYAGGADADVAMFLYRAERYLPKQPPDKFAKESEEQWAKRKDLWEKQWAQARDRAEVIIEKRRSGPLTDVVLGFDGARTLLYELGEASLL